jgi:lysophospholipase L1-like esterase
MPTRREFVKLAAATTGAALTSGLTREVRGTQSSSTTRGVSMETVKRDYCNKPFKVAVALGESTTAGGTATSRELTWVSRLAELINESQIEPIQMVNSGIGGNVISRTSPSYEESGKPSAVERYQKHVIDHHPDLVLISYGLNDARGGTPLAQFLKDLHHVTLDIKEKTRAVVVIVNAYFMTGFDRYLPYNQANIATFMGYNCGMKRLAEECDVLYADVFAAEDMATWMIDPDGVHANNLGHRVIANRIFEVLAQNCSGLSQRAFELRKNFKQWRDESVLKQLY